MSSVSCIQSPPTDFLQRLVISLLISPGAASSLHLLLILCQGCFQAFAIPRSPFCGSLKDARDYEATSSPRAAFQSGDSERKRCSTALKDGDGCRSRSERRRLVFCHAASEFLSKCSLFRDIGRGPQSDSRARSNILCPFLFFVQRGPTQRRSLETCGSGPRSPCCLRWVLMTPPPPHSEPGS